VAQKQGEPDDADHRAEEDEQDDPQFRPVDQLDSSAIDAHEEAERRGGGNEGAGDPAGVPGRTGGLAGQRHGVVVERELLDLWRGRVGLQRWVEKGLELLENLSFRLGHGREDSLRARVNSPG